jgi:hypothetical protein
MVFRTSRHYERFSPLALLGVVCIALVFMAGLVQVAHSHPSGHPDHECSLCTSAHQVVQVVSLVTLALSVVPVVAVAAEPARRPLIPVFFFKLACRPPPASSALA